MSLASIPKICMLMWGIWPPEFIKNPSLRTWYLIYKYILVVYVSILAGSLISEWIRLIIFHKSAERISSSGSLVVTIILLSIKMLIYQKNKIPQRFAKFVEVETDIEDSNDPEVQKIYYTVLRYDRYLNIGVIIATTLAVSSFAIIDIIKLWEIGVEAWNFDEASFMYELYFPFDKKKYMIVVVAFNLYTIYMGGVLNVVCLLLIYTLIVFSALQLRILRVRLRKFHTFVGKYGKDISETLYYFIVKHQKSIEFVETLNQSVKYVMLIEFLLNSANVASVLFYIITVKSTDFFYAICLLALQLLQVFVIAWISNEVKLESLKVADAVYDSPWYEQDEKIKKLLHIILLRGQKPLTFTIGPFKPMVAETAIMTIQAAYSYATLMMKTYNK
ncbi:odorant receptor 49b-like [Sitophilus oryzae]|uniref:Odorant receptor n=1 Tax=Sitophilus oryzae TaxID=7048 RepID=A0A6J2YKR8_SITOR|nr:odorant receptor 49b-like [Sitophilus oryzae]